MNGNCASNFDISPRNSCPSSSVLDADNDGAYNCYDCDDSNPYVQGPLEGRDCLPKPKQCNSSGGLSNVSKSDDCCSHPSQPIRPMDGTMYYAPPPDISIMTRSGFPLTYKRSYDTKAVRLSGEFDPHTAGDSATPGEISFGNTYTSGAFTLDRMIVKTTDHNWVAYEGPRDGKYAPADGSSMYALRAVVHGDEIWLTAPNGRIYVFDYPSSHAGQRYRLKHTVESDGTQIAYTFGSTGAVDKMLADDGTFIRRRSTSSGYAMDYGRGETVEGSVSYELSDIELGEDLESPMVTAVTWSDGRSETLYYTAVSVNQEPFEWRGTVTPYGIGIPPPECSDYTHPDDGAIHYCPISRAAIPFALLSEVRNSFGELVERHGYNRYGVVVTSETPNENWSFERAEVFSGGNLVGLEVQATDSISGEVRTYQYTGSRLTATISSCATCTSSEEIRYNSNGDRVATKDKRGTWSIYGNSGEARLVFRTDNGDPDAMTAVPSSGIYHKVEYDYTTGSSHSGSLRPNRESRPSVLSSGQKRYDYYNRFLDPEFDPNDPLLRQQVRDGYTYADLNGTIARQWSGQSIYYDSAGRMTQHTLPRAPSGEVENRTYVDDEDETPSAGRLHTVTRNCNKASETVGSCTLTTTYEDYDALGNAQTVIEANGVTRTMTYNALGQVTESRVHATGFDDLVTTYIYDRGRLTASRSAEGVITQYYYIEPDADGQGQLSAVVTGVGDGTFVEIERVEYAYYPTGLRAEERTSVVVDGVSQLRRISRFEYGVDKRLTRAFKFTMDADNASHVRDTFFNAAGDVVAIADENHASLNDRDQDDANILNVSPRRAPA